MSGLAGIFRLDGGPADVGVVRAMLAAISHRGPDGSAILARGPVAMGHVLLQVDERTPSPLEQDGLLMVADGRLDPAESSPQNTGTVSEWVADLYRQRGVDFAADTHGDFALALWDEASSRLILARDPMGTKPLFYWVGPRVLAFASECKAILALSDVPRRPCARRLAEYDRFRFRGLEETFFEGIRRVVPGQVVWHERGALHRRSFWLPPSGPPVHRPRETHTTEFRSRFLEAVRVRLPSSGVATVALSGGLDSSSIACAAAYVIAANRPGCSLKTLSVVPGRFPNEMGYASAVCRMWNLPNAVVDFDRFRIGQRLSEMVQRLESPFVEKEDEAFDQGMFATAATLGSRVLLMGYAGDETMTGWAYLADHLREGRWGRFFQEVRALRRGEGLPTWAVARRLSRFLLFPNRFLPGEPGVRFSTCDQMEMFVALFNLYQVMTLESWDMNAAASGVEVRLPFRDRNLIDIVLTLPAKVRIHSEQGKPLLRQALADLLPISVAERTGKCDYTEFWALKLKEAGFAGRSFFEQNKQWRHASRTTWEEKWFENSGSKGAKRGEA